MAILISIKPQYVCKILNKEKILEIRKSIPKCDLPCKVYIYCTKGKHNEWLRKFPFSIKETYYQLCDDNFNCLSGKVVAEFTLNKYDIIEKDLNDWLPKNKYETIEQQLKDSCLTEKELWKYGKGKTLYAWHIDDLIIYDKPKELNDFTKVLDCKYCIDYNRMDSGFICPDCINANRLKRPPQSYMFIEGE